MRSISTRRRLALVLLLVSFALTAAIYPDLVYFGLDPYDWQTF